MKIKRVVKEDYRSLQYYRLANAFGSRIAAYVDYQLTAKIPGHSGSYFADPLVH